MAEYTVGLDFGTRAIKLVEIDDTGAPAVTAFDEEPLPLDRDPYVHREGIPGVDEPESPEAEEDSGERETSDEQTGDEPPAPAGETVEEPTQPDDETGEAEWDRDFSGALTWVDALANLLSRHEFDKNTEFVTFLPEGRAISIHQDVPFYEPEKVREILPNLLEDRLPLEPEEMVYDFRIVTPETAEDHRAVVGLARREDIGSFLSRLQEGGVDPAVLGIPELLLRYVGEAAIPQGETAALVDIGHQFTRVVVLREGAVVMARSLQVGGANATRKLADKFGASLERAETHKIENGTMKPSAQTASRRERATSEAIRLALRPLVRDLRRNFQSLYAESKIELDAVYLCGGSSRIDYIDEYFADQFGVRVEVFPVESAIQHRRLEGSGGPESALALACALQLIRDPSGERLLDLRKGEFEYRGRSTYLRKQMYKFGAVAGILLVLFIGSLFAKKFELESKRTAMQQAIAQQSKEVFGKSVSDPEVVKNIARGETTTNRAFVPRMSAYQIYYELMSRVSDDIELALDRIDVDTDRNIVQMSGTTTDPQTVDTLVSDLEGLECIDDINKKPIRVRSEDETRFELEISSACS